MAAARPSFFASPYALYLFDACGTQYAKNLYHTVKIMKFDRAEFVAAALMNEHFPLKRNEHGDIFPEIAIAGRSNVGKSSLINHLLRTTGLARVSSSPGKTQTINFYSVDDQMFLVDLPGYGYAKVAKKIREEWGHWISEYFMKRKELKAVLLLLDIRRTPSEEDIAMAEWTTRQNIPLQIVFTKTDKVTDHEKQQFAKNALQTFSHLKGLASFPPIFYSIHEKNGRERLIRTLNTFL